MSAADPLHQQFIAKGLDLPRCSHTGEQGPRCDMCGERLSLLDVMVANGQGPIVPTFDGSASAEWDAECPPAGDGDPLVDYVNAKFDSGEWS